jgi:hypothetical protein
MGLFGLLEFEIYDEHRTLSWLHANLDFSFVVKI